MKPASERMREYRARQKEAGVKPATAGKTPAERMKEYRARKKEAGGDAPRGERTGSKQAKWDVADFIALDGEGESRGPMEIFTVGKDGKTYEAQEHFYTLLADSAGGSLYNGGARLDSYACLDYLLDLSDCHKRSIFVIFAGSYDINHMLLFGFDREILQEIARGESIELENNGEHYSLEYRARKSLTLRRGLTFNSKGKPVWKSRMVIWDVFGFFQESFAVVMGKWLGKAHRHYELISRMKLMRGNFAEVSQSDINAYNAAELETLVELMVKVRDSIDGLGLKCRRWDGAGAVAAALMLKHEIKKFKKETAEEIHEAVRTAYAGGRIEVCKIGRHDGPVFDYDVNSAYPSVMAGIPCLACGTWKRGTGAPPKGFTLVHCQYEFFNDAPFYPLFYRNEKMQICFPQSGEGWYWYPEFAAAESIPGVVDVIEYWHFEPGCNHVPFGWIPEYYATRQQWVKNPTEAWQGGGEKIIKLGLNSLYGKSAQQSGSRGGNPPAYHQMEWAGYITSATRAKLFMAANLAPDTVIGFATDGIFTTAPLPMECSTTKVMGAWELKEPVPVGITIAMAGVYWWHKLDGGFEHFSRGFDKDSMRTPEKVIAAWKAGAGTIDIPMRRLIGMGSACASDSLWDMRGRFTTGMRTLRIDGNSHKRMGINVKKDKPHKQLVSLAPSPNIDYEECGQGCSHPYPLEWLDNGELDEFTSELELLRELGDTENI